MRNANYIDVTATYTATAPSLSVLTAALVTLFLSGIAFVMAPTVMLAILWLTLSVLTFAMFRDLY